METGRCGGPGGIPDPGRPYRMRRLGGWTTDDFKSGPEQKKTWEVTKFVSGPGRYQVVFQYESGWYGAGIKQVALVATPAQDPMNRTELARDRHQGTTGHQPKNTTYELQLATYDPAQRYFLIADLVGPPVNSPSDRSDCTGSVTVSMAKETALNPSTPQSDGAFGRTTALRDKAWTWGYVIPGQVPGEVPFVGRSSSQPRLRPNRRES